VIPQVICTECQELQPVAEEIDEETYVCQPCAQRLRARVAELEAALSPLAEAYEVPGLRAYPQLEYRLSHADCPVPDDQEGYVVCRSDVEAARAALDGGGDGRHSHSGVG